MAEQEFRREIYAVATSDAQTAEILTRMLSSTGPRPTIAMVRAAFVDTLKYDPLTRVTSEARLAALRKVDSFRLLEVIGDEVFGVGSIGPDPVTRIPSEKS